MHDEPHLDPLLGQFPEHGIEQERHVVVDDLDDRHPADLMRIGDVGAVLDADVGGAGLALAEERPRRFGQRGQFPGVVAQQIFSGGAAEEERHEPCGDVAAAAVDDDLGLDRELAPGALFVAADKACVIHGCTPHSPGTTRLARQVSRIRTSPSRSDRPFRPRMSGDSVRLMNPVRQHR